MTVPDIKFYAEKIYEFIQLFKTELSKCQILEIIETRNFNIPKKLRKLIVDELRCKDRGDSIKFLEFLHEQLEELSKLPEENIKNFYYSNSKSPLPEKILAQLMLDIFNGNNNKVVQFGKDHSLKIYEKYDSRPISVKTYSIFGKKSELKVNDLDVWKIIMENYNNNMTTMEITDPTSQHWTNVAETWYETYQTPTELKLMDVNLSATNITSINTREPIMYNFINGVWSKNENFYNINLSDSVWKGIALSDSGNYQIACGNTGICVSSDGGYTWVKKVEGLVFDCCGISGDGKYMIAGILYGEFLYVSSDYGNSFQIKKGQIPHRYINFSLSQDGKIQVAARYKKLDVSYDYGNTWYTLVNKTIHSTCINSDGTHLTFCADNSIYVSNLENGLYTEPILVLIDSKNSNNISMDITGQYQIAHRYDNSYMVSSDFGQTWYYRDGKFNNVIISGFGHFSIAVNNSFYTSISTPVNTNWEFLYDTKLNLKLLEQNKIDGVIATDGKTIYYSYNKQYEFIKDEYFQNNEITGIAAGEIISVSTTNGAYVKKDGTWRKVLDGSFDHTAINSSYILFSRSDGTELLLSNDMGDTFTPTFQKTYADKYYDLGISMDGRIQVAVSQKYTNVSYNYGTGWFEYGWYSSGGQAIALSQDGRFFTVGYDNHLAISEIGENGQFQTPFFVYTDPDIGNFINITMSFSGMRQIAVFKSETGIKYLASFDRGHTWDISTDAQFNNVIINTVGDSLVGINNSFYAKNNSQVVTDQILGLKAEQISETQSIIVGTIEEQIYTTAQEALSKIIGIFITIGNTIMNMKQ